MARKKPIRARKKRWICGAVPGLSREVLQSRIVSLDTVEIALPRRFLLRHNPAGTLRSYIATSRKTAISRRQVASEDRRMIAWQTFIYRLHPVVLCLQTGKGMGGTDFHEGQGKKAVRAMIEEACSRLLPYIRRKAAGGKEIPVSPEELVDAMKGSLVRRHDISTDFRRRHGHWTNAEIARLIRRAGQSDGYRRSESCFISPCDSSMTWYAGKRTAGHSWAGYVKSRQMPGVHGRRIGPGWLRLEYRNRQGCTLDELLLLAERLEQENRRLSSCPASDIPPSEADTSIGIIIRRLSHPEGKSSRLGTRAPPQ